MIVDVFFLRIPKMLPLACMAGLLCFFIRLPSTWLVFATFAYKGMRAGGMGHQLGQNEMNRVDAAVMGGLLLTTGGYALACSGVAPSGFVTGLAMTLFYGLSVRKLPERPWTLIVLTVALTWMMIVYRAMNPGSYMIWGCCCGVG